MHQPSVRVLKLISSALNVSAEQLLAQAGLLEGRAGGDAAGPSSVQEAIESVTQLDESQKAALIAVYRGMLRP